MRRVKPTEFVRASEAKKIKKKSKKKIKKKPQNARKSNSEMLFDEKKQTKLHRKSLKSIDF